MWIGCHTADGDEPWYDETSEDDYRPYSGEAPAPPYQDLFVVRAEATLFDGTRLPALMDLLPVPAADRDSAAHATLFAADGRRVSLLPASRGLGEQVRLAALDALDRDQSQVFPVRVATELAAAPVLTVLDWFTQRVTWPRRP